LSIGHGYGRDEDNIIVPPNTADFVVAGHCSSDCTQKHVPLPGISVFNVLMHSHMSGKTLIKLWYKQVIILTSSHLIIAIRKEAKNQTLPEWN